MKHLSDCEAELIAGGLRIMVNPTIAISTAVITGLQGSNATSLGLGVLGSGTAGISQYSGLDLATVLGNLAA